MYLEIPYSESSYPKDYRKASGVVRWLNYSQSGCFKQEIADQLYLSLKCVQNYMPYTKGMNNGIMTENAKKSREKRDRMKKALENQVGSQQAHITPENGKEAVMSKEMLEDMMNHLSYENIGELIRKEDRPEKAMKKYLPSVFKLKLELVDYYGDDLEWYDDELAVLRKYAKVQNGFTREVLVPTSMSLNALNYMIQKLYGWQNGHLHSFSLPKDVFNSVTDNGDILQWEKFCGVLFRFPEDEDGDRYCGDDYDGTKSFKTWLKNKYCASEPPFCVSDTYIENQRHADEFEQSDFKKSLQGISTLEQMERAVDMDGPCDTLVERLTLGELLCTNAELPDMALWRNDIAEEIKTIEQLSERYKQNDSYQTICDGLAELRQCRDDQVTLDYFLQKNGKSRGVTEEQLVDMRFCNRIKITSIEKWLRVICTGSTPKLNPLTDTLLYRYDFGDGWCVRVTCEESYSINDAPNESDAAENDEFSAILQNIVCKKAPICIAADGLCLLDDVGGVHGFVDMLKTIHGDDLDEAEEMREWARGMGWTGRMSKPEKML